MPESIALSNNIIHLRKAMGLSQIEFAVACGISPETLSLIERGLSDPKLSTIQKLAAYTGYSVPDLLKAIKWES